MHMHKFGLSLVGGLALALAVSGASLAAASAPSAAALARVPAAPVATLTWKTDFAKAPVDGSARLTGPSTYAWDKVSVSATGIKKGAHLTLRLFEKDGSRYRTFAAVSVTASLTAKGKFERTWYLAPSSRQALRSAVAHKLPIYFRLVDGKTVATGLLARVP